MPIIRSVHSIPLILSLAVDSILRLGICNLDCRSPKWTDKDDCQCFGAKLLRTTNGQEWRTVRYVWKGRNVAVLPTVHLFYLVTLNFVLNSHDISTVRTYVWRDFDNTDGIRLNAWICLGNVGHVLFKVILKLAYIAIYKSYCINFVDFDNSFWPSTNSDSFVLGRTL